MKDEFLVDKPAGEDRTAAALFNRVGPSEEQADNPAGGDRAAGLSYAVVPAEKQADNPAGRDWANHVVDGFRRNEK